MSELQQNVEVQNVFLQDVFDIFYVLFIFKICNILHFSEVTEVIFRTFHDVFPQKK